MSRGRYGGSGVKRWPLLALLAALVLTLAAVAAGCGGDDEASTTDTGAASSDTGGSGGGEAIKIGHLSNCEGPFAPFYENTVAGSMIPLLRRGGEAAGAKPSDGVTGAEVAGHPIELVFGCSDATPDKAAEEARRLVEQEKVDILIGPLSGSEGIAVAEYSKSQPDVTFVNGTSGAQDTTLKVQSPNFFRWNTEGAQWMAGLGDYAYNELGWRNVVTLADDYDFPYTQVAGFVAEFCSLGGTVEKRIWPPLGEEDYSSYIQQIPSTNLDGFFLGVGGTGTLAFVKGYEELGRGNLADKIIAGSVAIDPVVLKEIGPRMEGVVSGSPVDAQSTDELYTKYIEDFTAAYPDVPGPESLFAVNNFDAMEATLQSLEAVDGDISDGGAKLRETMTGLTLEAPNGTITLDENRNAVGSNYLVQVGKLDSGDLGLKTLKEIPEVDQTFGGAFSADTPTPDRKNPECVKGDPPPWASGG
jgi:branched-chain amino acid transport system substrate-binding protein